MRPVRPQTASATQRPCRQRHWPVQEFVQWPCS